MTYNILTGVVCVGFGGGGGGGAHSKEVAYKNEKIMASHLQKKFETKITFYSFF